MNKKDAIIASFLCANTSCVALKIAMQSCFFRCEEAKYLFIRLDVRELRALEHHEWVNRYVSK